MALSSTANNNFVEQQNWELSGNVIEVALSQDSNTVFVGFGNGNSSEVYAVKASNGQKLWNLGFESITLEFVVVGTTLVVVADSEAVYVLDQLSGTQVFNPIHSITNFRTTMVIDLTALEESTP